MNSEELEQSLRAEFENYLKSVLSEMREETVEFKKKIEAEFEEQKSHFDLAFQAFSSRFENEHQFDIGFTETVTEHLRLARDEGSQIAANAFVEAEELEKASSPPVSFADLNEAVSDISSKDTQSTILKSLIDHASEYTPRGAFFIIKNEHFVGWKVFGKDGPTGETAIREIHFPISSDSILGKAVTLSSTVEGSYGSHTDDSAFLETLEFGRPDRMYAVPLMARGRAVAVLYADYGSEGVMLNTDALETLVRVAGMTVELLASAKAVRSGQEGTVAAGNITNESESLALNPTANFNGEEISSAIPNPGDEYQPSQDSLMDSSGSRFNTFEPTGAEGARTSFGEFAEPIVTKSEPISEESGFTFAETAPGYGQFVPEKFEKETETETYGSFEPAKEVNIVDAVEESSSTPPIDGATLADELSSYHREYETLAKTEKPTPQFEAMPPVETVKDEVPDTTAAFDPPPFATPAVEDTNPYEAPPFDVKTANFEPTGIAQVAGIKFNPDAKAPPVAETVQAAAPSRTRLSDRNVDLPIDVPEDERRLHNDARRFARLLVSEIKLYNEKKVLEGRDASDLYERLKEAIDRSREMYDKRVQPPVAAKFDYFHYELVNALSDGTAERLGKNYPGATI